LLGLIHLYLHRGASHANWQGQITDARFSKILIFIKGILGGFLASFVGLNGSHWIGQIVA